MNTADVVALVVDVKQDRVTDAQRDALAELILVTYVAVQGADDPDDPWAAVAEALRALITPIRDSGNVVQLRPCPGRQR